MRLHDPSFWWLLLALPLPLIWGWRWWSARRTALVYASTEWLRDLPTPWTVHLRWLPGFIGALGLLLLIAAAARPQTINERRDVRTEGIAIQLVVDRSGSMSSLDFELQGEEATRMEAVKAVVEDFISGGEALPGRPNDLIGVVAFASFADALAPLTLDHGHLVDAIRALHVATQREGAATALGDAIALGVERMQSIDEQRSGLAADAADITRIMIVLTDGESNAGEIHPITAARMAATFGIRLYAIGVGSQRGMAPVRVTDPLTGREFLEYRPVSLDEETLRQIAEIGEGRYFRATDPDSLREVYATIDRLERTELEERRLIDYGEMAIQPVIVGGRRIPPLAVIALGLLVLESVLALTKWRMLP